MKRIIIGIVLMIFFQNLFSQEENNQQSKMLDFVSKKGVILKFEDYNLPNLKTKLYVVAESKIRRIISGSEEKYFLQISKKGKYGNDVASIAYEDILEIQKALSTLKNQSEVDKNSASDYLENKFITDDGLKVGYYVNNSKVSWYVNLDNGSDSTIFLKDSEDLLKALALGKQKIEELKD